MLPPNSSNDFLADKPFSPEDSAQNKNISNQANLADDVGLKNWAKKEKIIKETFKKMDIFSSRCQILHNKPSDDGSIEVTMIIEKTIHTDDTGVV